MARPASCLRFRPSRPRRYERAPVPRHGAGAACRRKRAMYGCSWRADRALGPRRARPRMPVEVQVKDDCADALKHGISDHLAPRAGGNHLLRPAQPARRLDRKGERSPRRRLGCRAQPRDGRRLLARRHARRTRSAISPTSMVDAGGIRMASSAGAASQSSPSKRWSDGATSTPTPTWLPAATSSIHPSHRTPPTVLRELTELGVIGNEAAPRLVASELLASSPVAGCGRRRAVST